MTSPLELVATGVVVRRARRDVLDQVSVRASAGRMLAAVGPSGSGKTTLLGVLCGLVRPEAGEVRVGTDRVDGSTAQRARFGFLLQTHALLPVLTAAENVEVALRARGVRPADAAAAAREVLADVGLDQHADRLVEQLSGGQQQRVALARALAPRPDVVLADEPTSELDSATRDRMVDLLESHARRGAVVVLATHDPDVADRCEDRVDLHDGRVVPAP
ncbi:ABC transporter ATP-binding protein [Angustibacter speluncae]